MVGRNIKILREANGFTQEQMSQYLGVQRSAYANYEACKREMPIDAMEKAADLFGCDLSLFYEEDPAKVKNALAYAFRVENLSINDMQEIAHFKKVVKNYLKISKMLEE